MEIYKFTYSYAILAHTHAFKDFCNVRTLHVWCIHIRPAMNGAKDTYGLDKSSFIALI